jgi:hypothetical protein
VEHAPGVHPRASAPLTRELLSGLREPLAVGVAVLLALLDGSCFHGRASMPALPELVLHGAEREHDPGDCYCD